MKNFLIFLKCHKANLHISKLNLIFALRKKTKTIIRMKAKVYQFMADGFEDVEALIPVDVLRRGGVDIKAISPFLVVHGGHKKTACKMQAVWGTVMKAISS